MNIMVKGAMYLYDKEETVLMCRNYEGKKMRNRALKFWKSMYGKKFNECVVQYNPFVNIELVDVSGLNVRVYANYKAKYYDTTQSG